MGLQTTIVRLPLYMAATYLQGNECKRHQTRAIDSEDRGHMIKDSLKRSAEPSNYSTLSALPIIGEDYPLVLLGSTWYYLRSPAGNFLWVSAI